MKSWRARYKKSARSNGAVASVKVELQPAVAVPGVTQSVLVTVHFEAAESAAKAMAVMNGRLFAEGSCRPSSRPSDGELAWLEPNPTTQRRRGRRSSRVERTNRAR